MIYALAFWALFSLALFLREVSSAVLSILGAATPALTPALLGLGWFWMVQEGFPVFLSSPSARAGMRGHPALWKRVDGSLPLPAKVMAGLLPA